MKGLLYVGIAVGAYLLGSISPALIVSHHFMKKDIRKYGSGNAGATNMVRSFGWGYGLITFALDILKGALAAYLGGLAGQDLGMALAGACVVLGHNLPVYYRFKGGKGISSTLGVYLVMRPVETLVILGVAVLIIALTQIVSIGSIAGVILEAVSVFVLNDVGLYSKLTIVCLAVFGLIGHIPNMKRLLAGRENKIRAKSNKEKLPAGTDGNREQ